MAERKHKAICNHCNGNGYIKVNVPSYSEVHQCPTCKSEGEIEIKEPNVIMLEEMASKARLQ